ncbi:MAG TPA: asparagine synthase (glutamine-hydrolyzing) [Steroidobacteraceae bacterium]|jgi:asparagine synthase (glutamine-hydrolysing)|nr:asparagine synthase (glutamine-hydrolyzing) [Steroidobacteraceae bacterium]
MCGIAGFAGIGSRDDIVAMTAALAHRGPDGCGYAVDPTDAVYLGNRRLAIIDIAGGVQPMANEDRSIVVVMNGEIYNHRALRKELEAVGQRFTSDHSDTEVLVRGYSAWGDRVIDRLDGMFAVAIYDKRRRRLVLARDRFGEKPLFFMSSADGFVFASELPSLRRHPVAAAKPISALALRKFFAYSFMPARLTPFMGIEKVLAGTVVTADLVSRSLSERRYWRFAIAPEAAPPGGPDDWAEEVASLLKKAVQSRLESDVPLGVFLSGGIDSSAMATFASELIAPNPIDTFTIGFVEASFDETACAQRVATIIASRHHVEVCHSDSMREVAPEILQRMGEPLGDPSLIPTFMLARLAASSVKVALSGDGGDELFAGYDPFKALRRAEFYRTVVPRPLHRALRLMAARLRPSDRNMSLDFKLNRTLRGLSYRSPLWNPVWLAALDPEELARVFEGNVSVEDLYSEAIEAWDNSASSNLVDRTLEFFTTFYLTDDILVKSDRAAMLNSLEVRAPFLAPSLADYVSRLPANVKYRGGTTKWILKRALQGLLPADIINRRKKGFGIPVAQWLREMETLNRPSIEHINEAPFRTWEQQHQRRYRDHRGALWCRFALDHSLVADHKPITTGGSKRISRA